MSTATPQDLYKLEKQAAELACLVHMAFGMAEKADDEGDIGQVWRLRALLSAMQLHASDLANGIGAQVKATRVQGGAA